MTFSRSLSVRGLRGSSSYLRSLTRNASNPRSARNSVDKSAISLISPPVRTLARMPAYIIPPTKTPPPNPELAIIFACAAAIFFSGRSK